MEFTYTTNKANLNGLCGIYMLRNNLNDKKYVGSSKNVYFRLAGHKHRLKVNRHDNEHLQNAYNKDGLEVFEVSVLEECQEAELADREKYWIGHYNCLDKQFGYNKSDVSDNRRNTVSQETRSKISKSLMNNSVILMLDKVSGSTTRKFDSLFEAAEYIISESNTTASPNQVRMKISQAARNKLVTTGRGRQARRASAYGYKWEVCHRMWLR